MSRAPFALRLGLTFGLFSAFAFGESIENWPAPPFWSRIHKAAPTAGGSRAIVPGGAEGMPSAAAPFVAVAPCRVVDTRNPNGPYGGPALAAHLARTFDVDDGPCAGIPPDAEAYSLSIGGILAPADGFLTAWPTGTPQPAISQLNLLAAEVVANAAVVPAGTNGSIDILVNVGPTDVYVDINGYYGGGVVTSVTAGAGLEGGGTGNVSIGLSNLGVDTAQIADGAVTAPKVAMPLFLSASESSPAFSVSNTGTGNGIQGISTGQIGVVGANLGGGVGVLGNSPTGFAMKAEGSTAQTRSSGGWVKAMVRVAASALSRCFNTLAASAAGAESCTGFVLAGSAGSYTVTFPFQVDDRFVSVTAESVIVGPPRCCMIQYNFPASNQVRVRTWDESGNAVDRGFSLVVF